jgi:hypothetical protein
MTAIEREHGRTSLLGEREAKSKQPARSARRDAKSKLAQVRAHHDRVYRRDPHASTRDQVAFGQE